MDNTITEKIKELIEFAKNADDKNAQIILLALLGARESGDDSLLAAEVQRYLIEVLIPKTKISMSIIPSKN